MFIILILLRGVYIEVYRMRFVTPNAAVNAFMPKYKVVTPVTAQTEAKLKACTGL